MWLFFNDSMLSVVQHKDSVQHLLVRARQRQDILNVFPDVESKIVHLGPEDADYAYRVMLSRDRVIQEVSKRVMDIDYTNFKNSIPEEDSVRRYVYMNVWQDGTEFAGFKMYYHDGLPTM